MSVNKVFLLGNLGKDPELRYTPTQQAVCNFPVATNERRKSADGEWTDHTEWHTVVVWGKQAENCNQFLAKGRQAFIEGRLQTRKWQDQDGKDRYKTEIVASTVQFVGGRGDSPSQERSFTSSPPSQSDSSDGSSSVGREISFEDDDIPF